MDDRHGEDARERITRQHYEQHPPTLHTREERALTLHPGGRAAQAPGRLARLRDEAELIGRGAQEPPLGGFLRAVVDELARQNDRLELAITSLGSAIDQLAAQVGDPDDDPPAQARRPREVA